MPSSTPLLGMIQMEPADNSFCTSIYNTIFYIHSKIAPWILANPIYTPRQSYCTRSIYIYGLVSEHLTLYLQRVAVLGSLLAM
jgi:hypothetical protein